MPLGMWFWRGFQSAIFYYISCAPCTKVAYRRKRRKESERAKAEKALAGPGPYSHPLPSSTNPYWKEEMVLGPGPPPKRGTKEKGKKKTSTDGRDSPSGGVASSTGTGTSSDTMEGVEMQQVVQDSGAGWNKRRYQREDEVLWGRESDDQSRTKLSPISRSGSGAGNYYYARNPAVNDLHPPVVSSQPTTRSETLWMLQPPPKAKVMEGKERDNRCRSSTNTSHGSRSSSKRPVVESSLGRQLMESRLPKGEYPPQAPSSTVMSRGPSNQSLASAASRTTVKDGQYYDGDTSNATTDVIQRSGSRNRKPPPVSLNLTPQPLLSTPDPARPPLSTIPSSSLPQNKSKPVNPSTLPTTASASSLQILGELNPHPNTSTNLRKAASTNSRKENSPPKRRDLEHQNLTVAKVTELPPANAKEEKELALPVFESRWPGDGAWDFNGQRHDGTDGHLVRSASLGEEFGGRGRWSMDI